MKNKSLIYFQVLLAPNRSELIEELASLEGIKGTAWIRNVVYRKLEEEFPSSIYRVAEAKDKLIWRETVKRRIDGRSKKKAS